MEYQTPKIVVLASAMDAIHGGAKAMGPAELPVDGRQTIGAYEADE